MYELWIYDTIIQKYSYIKSKSVNNVNKGNNYLDKHLLELNKMYDFNPNTQRINLFANFLPACLSTFSINIP